MKIKIIESGYEGYTGFFGITEFENGVSVDEVSQKEINTLAALVRIADASDETETALSIDMRQAGGSVTQYKTLAEIQAEEVAGEGAEEGEKGEEGAEDDGEKGAEGDGNGEAGTEAQTPHVYTREELAAIADAKGITGLREVADIFGVKGASITQLIEKILDKQPKPADEAPAGEGDAAAESDKE